MVEKIGLPTLTIEQAQKAILSFDKKARLAQHEDSQFYVFVGVPKDVPSGVEIQKGKKWETGRHPTELAAWNEAASYLNVMSSNLHLCGSCFTFLRSGRKSEPHPECPSSQPPRP